MRELNTIVSEVKRALEIPADDVRWDSFLKRALEASPEDPEAIANLKRFLAPPEGDYDVFHRDSFLGAWVSRLRGAVGIIERMSWAKNDGGNPTEFWVDSPRPEIAVPTLSEMIRQALIEIQYKRYICEEDYLQTERLVESTVKLGRTQPNYCMIWVRRLAVFKAGDLSCSPAIRLTFKPKQNPPGSASVTSDLILRFIRATGNKTQRMMDVFVEWGETERRSLLTKKEKKETFQRWRVNKRLYLPPKEKGQLPLPEKNLTRREEHKLQEDTQALLCLYLIQEKLVSLEEDQAVRDFLWFYFRRRRGIKQEEIGSVISEILHAYQVPEDYRSFSLYVAKTIHGFAAEQHKQHVPYVISDPEGKEHDMIPRVADQLGIPWRRLYCKVESGGGTLRKSCVWQSRLPDDPCF